MESLLYGSYGKPSLYTDRIAKQPLARGVSWDFSEQVTVTPTTVPLAYYAYCSIVPANEIWIIENIAMYKASGWTVLETWQTQGGGTNVKIYQTNMVVVGWHTKQCELTMTTGGRLYNYFWATDTSTFYIRYRARVISLL